MTRPTKTQFSFLWNNEYAVLTTLKIGTRYLQKNREVLSKGINFTVSTSGSGLLVTLKEGCNLDHQIDFYQRKCGGSFLDFISRFKKLYVLVRDPQRRAISGLIQAINHHISDPETLVANSPEKYVEVAEQKMRELPTQILNDEHLDPYHFFVDKFLKLRQTDYEVVDLPNFNLFPRTEKRSNSTFIDLLSNNSNFQNLLFTKSFLIEIEELYYSNLKKLSKNVSLSRTRTQGIL